MAAYRIKYCSKCERSTGHDISGACMVCGVVLPKTVVSKAPLSEDMRDFNAKRFQSWENHWLQFLDIDSRRHVNCLRFSRSDSGRSESDAHIQAKLDEVKKALSLHGTKNVEFMSEALASDRVHRADLIFFIKGCSVPEVVEIACSEKQESLDEKRKFWESLGFSFREKKL